MTSMKQPPPRVEPVGGPCRLLNRCQTVVLGSELREAHTEWSES